MLVGYCVPLVDSLLQVFWDILFNLGKGQEAQKNDFLVLGNGTDNIVPKHQYQTTNQCHAASQKS